MENLILTLENGKISRNFFYFADDDVIFNECQRSRNEYDVAMNEIKGWNEYVQFFTFKKKKTIHTHTLTKALSSYSSEQKIISFTWMISPYIFHNSVFIR